MILEYLRKSLPVPNGCCGVEFPSGREESEAALLKALEEITGRRWVNTLSVFEDLNGGRLIVHHFPRNLRRAERLGIHRLPALVFGGDVLISGDISYKEIRAILEEALNRQDTTENNFK
ncbi:hypothetical protein [Candidatus Pyrohabitans sp.]